MSTPHASPTKPVSPKRIHFDESFNLVYNRPPSPSTPYNSLPIPHSTANETKSRVSTFVNPSVVTCVNPPMPFDLFNKICEMTEACNINFHRASVSVGVCVYLCCLPVLPTGLTHRFYPAIFFTHHSNRHCLIILSPTLPTLPPLTASMCPPSCCCLLLVPQFSHPPSLLLSCFTTLLAHSSAAEPCCTSLWYLK